MKVIILAGGKGSRISYYTQKIPKPMIKIGGSPILSGFLNTTVLMNSLLQQVTKKKLLINIIKIQRNLKMLR